MSSVLTGVNMPAVERSPESGPDAHRSARKVQVSIHPLGGRVSKTHSRAED